MYDGFVLAQTICVCNFWTYVQLFDFQEFPGNAEQSSWVNSFQLRTTQTFTILFRTQLNINQSHRNREIQMWWNTPLSLCLKPERDKLPEVASHCTVSMRPLSSQVEQHWIISWHIWLNCQLSLIWLPLPPAWPAEAWQLAICEFGGKARIVRDISESGQHPSNSWGLWWPGVFQENSTSVISCPSGKLEGQGQRRSPIIVISWKTRTEKVSYSSDSLEDKDREGLLLKW